MMTQEELTLHIRKKFGAGYGEDELRNELLVQGYSEMEISNAILLAQKEEKKPVSPLAIVVSVLFIAMGAWRISQGSQTWGAVLVAWGVISLIVRVLPLLRR